jgi:hypothetical protein
VHQQLVLLNEPEKLLLAATWMAVLLQHLEQQMLLLTAVLRHVAMQRQYQRRLERLLPAAFLHETMRQQQHWYFEWQQRHWKHAATLIENLLMATRKRAKLLSQQRWQLEKPQSAVLRQVALLSQQLR